MNGRFVTFLWAARWASAVMALMYHVRFLQFVDYDAVASKSTLSKEFYFLTGLGHESFAVFFVLDGIVAGLILLRQTNRIPISRHVRALYALLLPGLLLGALFDYTGAQFFNQSGIYTHFPDFSTLTLGYSSLLGNAFMLQPFIVPTFGSNGMLYLLSYLFWSFILLVLFVRAADSGKPRRRLLHIALPALVLVLMPAQFLNWAAIWLTGVAVVVLGESRRWRPPLLLGLAGFFGALVVSRLIGSHTGLLPQPFGAWLVHFKYIGVGIGFAALAAALYPVGRPGNQHLAASVIDSRNGKTAHLASFAFFFHFPVVMLIFACATSLLHRPLMQQPTPARYAAFIFIVGLSIAITTITAHAFTAVLKRIYITIIPLLKSISLRSLKRE
jgi:hypothetical protein